MVTPTRHRTSESAGSWIDRVQKRSEDRSRRKRSLKRSKRDAAFAKARDLVDHTRAREVVGILAVIGAALVVLAMGSMFSSSHEPERLGEAEPVPQALASINARESYQGLPPFPATGGADSTAPDGALDLTGSGQNGSNQNGGGSNSFSGSTATGQSNGSDFGLGTEPNLPDLDEPTTFDDAALLASGVTIRPEAALATTGLVVTERSDAGLGAITPLNSSLTASATNHAMWLAANGELCHTTECNKGAQPSTKFAAWGENIGYRGDGNMQALHQAFKASPPHYKNMLDPRWTQMGVGAAEGKLKDGREAVFVVVQFGT